MTSFLIMPYVALGHVDTSEVTKGQNPEFPTHTTTPIVIALCTLLEYYLRLYLKAPLLLPKRTSKPVF